MANYQLRLSNGTLLTAIKSLRLTWQVNDSADLSLGSACAAMLEATVFGCPGIGAGERITCLESGEVLGSFLCQQPRRTGENTLAVTGYDAMIRFDRDIGPWLEGLSFPMEAQALLEALCDHCGVPLAGEPLPAFSVAAFTQPSLTGRQLLQYLGQVAGRFFRIDPEGNLLPGWYAGEKTLTGYRMGSLTLGDAPAAPIARVLIRTTEQETGAVWPDGTAEEANTYILQGNPLLPPSADRQAVAQRLYEQLKDYRCTPFSCALLPGERVEAGSLLTLPDGQTSPVMKLTLIDGQRRVEASASPSLQNTEAFNRLSLSQIPGRVLNLERTAEGLKVEHTDLLGSTATLELTLEGITARVTATEEQAAEHALKSQVTALEQTAESLSISVTQLQEQADSKADREELEEVTEHFLFDAQGLTISNTATGMGINISEQQVAFTGGESPTTVITPNTMQTTNLNVQTRLDLGGFSFLPRTNQNLSLRYTAK